jgi:hypothetical protein
VSDYRLSFRIRQNYFEEIVFGVKDSEVRRASKFWNKRVYRALRELNAGNRVVAVFVCGKKVHRRYVRNVWRYDSAAEALFRKPSKQGRKDLGRGAVWKFRLGSPV